jgi:hypothetical protein
VWIGWIHHPEYFVTFYFWLDLLAIFDFGNNFVLFLAELWLAISEDLICTAEWTKFSA